MDHRQYSVQTNSTKMDGKQGMKKKKILPRKLWGRRPKRGFLPAVSKRVSELASFIITFPCSRRPQMTFTCLLTEGSGGANTNIKHKDGGKTTFIAGSIFFPERNVVKSNDRWAKGDRNQSLMRFPQLLFTLRNNARESFRVTTTEVNRTPACVVVVGSCSHPPTTAPLSAPAAPPPGQRRLLDAAQVIM